MKVKQNYVSSQYHQVYFTFTAIEVHNIFLEVLTSHGFSDKEAKKKQKYIKELVMEKIESEIIEDELVKFDIIPIGTRRYRYLTEVSETSPLLVICQFCILPIETVIKFPSKIPNSLLETANVETFMQEAVRQVLITSEQYDYVPGEIIDIGSIVKYDLSYTKDDFIISEIKDQEVTLHDVKQNDRKIFLNHKVGDVVVLDNTDDVIVSAKITEITNFKLKELTDEVVANLNFLNIKTKEEFIEKLKSIFRFSTSTYICLDYITDFVILNGGIEFDEYVMNHHLDEVEITKKKEQEAYLEEMKRNLIKEVITWIVNLHTNDNDQVLMTKVMEEYELDKLLFNNPMKIADYQEYISKHSYEARVLQYCIENNIIDDKQINLF